MKFFLTLIFLASTAFGAETPAVQTVTCYANNLAETAVITYQFDSRSKLATLSISQLGQVQISDPVLVSTDTQDAFVATGDLIKLNVDKEKTVDLYTDGYIEDDSGLEHHATGFAGTINIPSAQISGAVGCTF